MSKGEQHERNKKKEKRGFVSYLAGAGRDAGDEAARRELLVEEGVQRAFRLALDQLALDVVRLGRGLNELNIDDRVRVSIKRTKNATHTKQSHRCLSSIVRPTRPEKSTGNRCRSPRGREKKNDTDRPIKV